MTIISIVTITSITSITDIMKTSMNDKHGNERITIATIVITNSILSITTTTTTTTTTIIITICITVVIIRRRPGRRSLPRTESSDMYKKEKARNTYTYI